jgi:hypothetical protein
MKYACFHGALISLLLLGLSSAVASPGGQQTFGSSNRGAVASQERDADRDDDDNHHKARRAQIILEQVALSPWEDGATVGIEVQLQNVGTAVARDLRVTQILVQGGSFEGPPSLPLVLGDVDPDAEVQFGAVLKVERADGSLRVLSISGDYRQKRHNENEDDDSETISEHHRKRRQRFDVTAEIRPNSAFPEPVLSTSGESPKQNPSELIYPTAPRTPIHDDESVFVPPGPPRELFPPEQTPTETESFAGERFAGSAMAQLARAADPGVHIGFNSTGPLSVAAVNKIPPDPNIAAESIGSNGVVIATYNLGVSFSTNGGAKFTNVNLLSPPDPKNQPSRTTFFPENDNGVCCDQVVVYIPNQNIFVWLLQHAWTETCKTNCKPAPSSASTFAPPITASNRLRIAWATPAAIRANFANAWTFIDLTGPDLGTKSNEALDYPDLASSDTFLYLGTDRVQKNTKLYPDRRIVARLSLADMADPAVTDVRFRKGEFLSNGIVKSHFVQGAPGRMVLGSIYNSSTTRIFDWPDDSVNPTPCNFGSCIVPISQIKAAGQDRPDYSSTDPDGTNWLAAALPGSITGAVFRNTNRDEYIFAFEGGRDNSRGRPQPYVRLETISPSPSFAIHQEAVAEEDIWNANFTWGMTALGRFGPATGIGRGIDIGMTLAVGGGTIGYPQEAVGIEGASFFPQVTNGNGTEFGIDDPSTGRGRFRFGDYFSTRPIPGGDLAHIFVTLTYDVVRTLPPGVTSGSCAVTGAVCAVNLRLVEFGLLPIP